MTVVSFTTITPPPRFDETAWTQVRIEESADGATGWAPVETITFDTPDSDPSAPTQRSVTTDLGTLDSGYYRAVWIDAAGDESIETESVIHLDADPRVRPTVSEVAALLRARTLGDTGEKGTFDSTTRPTATDVESLIDVAMTVVDPQVDADAASRAAPLARFAVALYTAMLIEVSYWPEQTDDDNSVYARLETRYNEALRALVAVVQAPTDGTVGETLYAL